VRFNEHVCIWLAQTCISIVQSLRSGEVLPAKVTEKFRRVNVGTLEIEITVDDPKAYTKPWTVKLTQRLMVDTDLIEFICEDRDATHYIGAAK